MAGGVGLFGAVTEDFADAAGFADVGFDAIDGFGFAPWTAIGIGSELRGIRRTLLPDGPSRGGCVEDVPEAATTDVAALSEVPCSTDTDCSGARSFVSSRVVADRSASTSAVFARPNHAQEPVAAPSKPKQQTIPSTSVRPRLLFEVELGSVRTVVPT